MQRGTRALKTRTTNGGASKGVAPPELASKLLSTILTSLDDSKAEEITSIDLDGKGAIADQMVIATGRSNRHVSAIADHLVEKLKAAGFANLRIEGVPQCDWVLVDSGDVVVHLFRPEVRSFYNLEKLWSPLAPDERIAV
ncbi:MAG TPA: ribosome silencing factor [Aestuariivirgaceae bacterium]